MAIVVVGDIGTAGSVTGLDKLFQNAGFALGDYVEVDIPTACENQDMLMEPERVVRKSYGPKPRRKFEVPR